MINTGRIYFKYQAQEKGQALLELAIFGSILIVIFGALLGYGLRYSYQQQMDQYVFRKALTKAADGSPVVHYQLSVRDRHIPSGDDSFGVGSVTPFSSSAAITRSNKLDETADYTPEDMPDIAIDVNNAPIAKNTFTTADFSYNVDGSNLIGDWDSGDVSSYVGDGLQKAKRRYEEVYGTGQFWRIDPSGNALDWDSGETLVSRRSIKTNELPFQRFLELLADNLPVPHEKPKGRTHGDDNKEEPSFIVEIIDGCQGNILDYDSCVRQCRLIVDDAVCQENCEDSGGTDCADACSKHIPVPWYCEGGAEIDSANSKWVFPNLKRLFDNTRFTAMGLQGESTQVLNMNNKLDTDEDTAGITNTDTFQWEIVTHRKIYYHPQASTERETIDVNTMVQQKESRTWNTPW